ncbi:MAG: phosphoesterase RecJ domain protein [Firmicutes bacterium]|nr:phosphoesterase RecJ domain protein [Bacillota bacterium]
MVRGPSLWFDTRIYLAVAAVLLMIIVFYNKFLAVIGAILLCALYLYGRERHNQQHEDLAAYLDAMTQDIGRASLEWMEDLPVGMAFVNAEGKICWFNKLLTEWSDTGIKTGDSIEISWPQIEMSRIWGKEGQKSFIRGTHCYEVNYKPLSGLSPFREEVLTLCFADITDGGMENKRHWLMPVLAYIQIDNYTDVLKSLDESQRSAILASVNQYITEWVGGLKGFIKKCSEDTYIALMDRSALDTVIGDKFDILDKVRGVYGGNRLPVTLSMGLAANEPSIAVLGQRVQAGLDLALGRGGDQAVVYLGNEAQFFGGKTAAVAKNTRVKARVVAQAIRDTIEDTDLVLVMGHTNEDFDSLGAALGAAKMARSLGKPTHVVVSYPCDAVDRLKEFMGEYEEYKDLFLFSDSAKELITQDTLLIIVDTHRPGITAAPELLDICNRIIVIDHHRRAEDLIANSMLVYMEPSASSTSELITELLPYFDETLELTRLEASTLYAGIVVDTKSFAVQSGVRTFEAASQLRRAGADPRLVRELFRVDLDTLKHRAEIINNTQMLPGGAVIAVYPKQVKNAQLAAAQAADMLLNIEGVEVSVVLFKFDDGVAVSARSQGEINVQVIMEEIGGGGHQSMAGAQVKHASMDEVKEKVLALVTKYIRESENHESNSATRD